MKLKIKEERSVKSLKDIHKLKQQLIKESDEKLAKMSKRFDNLITKSSPQLIYDNILEKFDLQHSLLNMLPLIFKYRQLITGSKLFSKIKNSPAKRYAIIGIGAIISALATYFYLNKEETKS
jgi:hypothetical protein